MRNQFIELLKEICTENGISLRLFSGDWIAKLGDPRGRLSFVYGYNFSLNSAAAAHACQDKNATFLILNSAGIPAVHHELFLNPGDTLVSPIIPSGGSMSRIMQYSSTFDFNVVLKPVCGTGGNGVVRARTCKEVEGALLALFQKYHGLVVSPFVTIKREIRVLVLNGHVRLVYEKKRPSVIGDGQSSLAVLVALQMGPRFNPLQLPSDLDMSSVPLKGEEIPIEWRHNLGHGASPVLIPEPDERLCDLAVRTAAALGVRFCSVDIVEGDNQTYSVLEVNSGVMMDSFIASSDTTFRAIAKSIYTDAILSSLV